MKTNAPDRERCAARPKRTARCLLALGMMAAAGNVWAACTSTVPGNGPLQAAMPGFTVSFPRSTPLGTVIYGSQGDNFTTNSGVIACNPISGDILMEGTLGGYESRFQTYASGVDGVGIRFYSRFSGGKDYFPHTESLFLGLTWEVGKRNAAYGVELVKIDDEVGQGSSIDGPITRNRIPSQGDFIYSVLSLSSPIIIVPFSPTCQVTTPDITLDIGTVDGKALKDSRESPLSPAQSIVLNCSGGDPGAEAGVYMVMTDAGNGANRTDKLPTHNEDGDPIPGLSVQLLRANGTPIAFGPDSNADDAPGQWKAGSTPNNPAYQIPIRARYVYSGTADIPGGTAGAAATFTMNYH